MFCFFANNLHKITPLLWTHENKNKTKKKHSKKVQNSWMPAISRTKHIFTAPLCLSDEVCIMAFGMKIFHSFIGTVWPAVNAYAIGHAFDSFIVFCMCGKCCWFYMSFYFCSFEIASTIGHRSANVYIHFELKTFIFPPCHHIK